MVIYIHWAKNEIFISKNLCCTTHWIGCETKKDERHARVSSFMANPKDRRSRKSSWMKIRYVVLSLNENKTRWITEGAIEREQRSIKRWQDSNDSVIWTIFRNRKRLYTTKEFGQKKKYEKNKYWSQKHVYINYLIYFAYSFVGTELPFFLLSFKR